MSPLPPLPPLPDAILCILLLATSAWCALVHRRLRSLLTYKGEMAAFIGALGAATGRAEAAIAALREAALREAAADLDQRQAEQAEVARQRGADLARAIENGGRLARRLEVDLDHGARTLAVGGRRVDARPATMLSAAPAETAGGTPTHQRPVTPTASRSPAPSDELRRVLGDAAVSIAVPSLGAAADRAGRYPNRTMPGVLLVVTAAACLGRVALLPLTSSTPAPAVGEPTMLIGDVPPGLPPPAPREPSIDAASDATLAAVAPAAGPGPASTSRVAADWAEVLDPDVLLQVALQLKERKTEVEKRERDVAGREAEVEKVRRETDAKLRQVETLKRDIDGLVERISDDDAQKVDRLVKVYEAMKPAKAAEILNGTQISLIIPIARRMREAKLAALIEEMDPQKAKAVTEELARAKELPKLVSPLAADAAPPPSAPPGTPKARR